MGTSPIFTAVLAYIMIKENLTPFDIICLILSFFGMLALIINKEDNPDGENHKDYDVLIAFILLMFFPIIKAWCAVT